MASFMVTARPYLVRAGKVLAKNTADVLANPLTGESIKNKFARIGRQSAIDIIINGLPKTQQLLPSSQTPPTESHN